MRKFLSAGFLLASVLPSLSFAYTEMMPNWSFQGGLAYGSDIQSPGLQLGLVYKFPFHERWRFGADAILFRKSTDQSGFSSEELTLRSYNLNSHYIFAQTDSWNFYLLGGASLTQGRSTVTTRTPRGPLVTAALGPEGQPVVVETPQEGFDEIVSRRDRSRFHVNLGLGLEYKIEYWGEIYLENVYVVGEYDQLVTSIGVRYTW